MDESTWLGPALILNTCAMTMVYGLSWLVQKQHPLTYYRWWVQSAGWRSIASLAGTLYFYRQDWPALVAVALAGTVLGSVALLDGGLTYRNPDRRMAWRWWLALGFIALSFGLLVAETRLPEVFFLPAFLLLSASQLYIAWVFWPRAGLPGDLGARIVSLGSGFFGLQSFVYPGVIALYPQLLGLLTCSSSLLTILIGMAMIIHLLEQSKLRAQTLGTQFRTANDQLAETSQALAQSRTEAQIFSAVALEQEALVRQIVHDLRNATQAMGLIAEELEHEAAGQPRVLAHVAALERQLAFISNFLKQKLAWIVDRRALTDAGTEIVPVLEDLALRFAPILASKGQRLAIAPASSSAPVRVSPIELAQILDNLVRNAHEHTPVASQIRLWATESDGWATFYVSDEGPGIPLDVQATFGRGLPRSDGTGVGMRNVADVVQRAGGLFGFVSEPGKGSTVHVSLPLLWWGTIQRAPMPADLPTPV